MFSIFSVRIIIIFQGLVIFFLFLVYLSMLRERIIVWISSNILMKIPDVIFDLGVYGYDFERIFF